ncbi:MAG: UPF0147 family protein [Candidatus Aenigmarchaeota archaeon]|nr:UPF0147 family protein [Candidatus Aenigmarchaeota archaeon]
MTDIKKILAILDEISDDKTVPKNIRLSIDQAEQDLSNERLEKTVRISSAISILDEAANDTNLPVYTRTQIMSVVSQLEAINRS